MQYCGFKGEYIDETGLCLSLETNLVVSNSCSETSRGQVHSLLMVLYENQNDHSKINYFLNMIKTSDSNITFVHG